MFLKGLRSFEVYAAKPFAFMICKARVPGRQFMQNLDSLSRREAGFIEPMECLAVTKLPEGPDWTYEIKLDGYRETPPSR